MVGLTFDYVLKWLRVIYDEFYLRTSVGKTLIYFEYFLFLGELKIEGFN